MKIAKIIYFSALPVFLALILVFSFVHVYNGGGKNQASADFIQNARRHANTLFDAHYDNLDGTTLNQEDTKNISAALDKILGNADMEITQASINSYKTIYDPDDEEQFYTIPRVAYTTSSGKIITNRFSHEYTLTVQKQIDYQKAYGNLDDLQVAVGRKIKNTVVVVPGQKTKNNQSADAILFTVHMDSPKMSASGVDASSIGVALMQIEELINYERSNPDKNAKYENDIVFLFTDARYDSSFGVHAFFDEFYGFFQTDSTTTAENPAIKDIVSRIKLAINFDSIGTGSSSMLLQTSSNNSALVREYAKMMGGNVSSSFISDIYSGYASDFAAFGSLNALNLVTFGNTGAYAGATDTVENVSDSLLQKKADLVINSVRHFGSMDLSKLDSSSDSIYFSFLGLFTINYPVYVSYIFGAIILLLIGGVVAANILKKRFSFKLLGKAMVVQLLSLGLTIAAMFVAYFAMSLLLAGFGLFTIQSITGYVFSNAGILLGYTMFAAVMLSLFYTITRKLINKDKPISAITLVRAGAALFIAVGAILSFAYPALATMFSIPSVLFLAVMLTFVLVKKFDLSRLFLYIVPFAISLAFIIPTVTVLALTVRAALLPITMLAVLMLLLTVSPYILTLIKPLNALAKRMPMRTIRVQKTVFERIEDKAKPGKYSESQVKKIVKEKIQWRYRHGVGAAVVAVLAVIVIMASSAGSVPFGANVYANPALKQPFSQYVSSIYNDSLLLQWTGTGGAIDVPEVHLEIHDKAAYKYFSNVLSGYSWDSGVNAYRKKLETNLMNAPIVNVGTDRIDITPSSFQGQRGVVEVYLSDISSVSQIIVFDGNNQTNKFSVAESSSITLRFPLSNASFSEIGIEFEFKSARTNQISMSYNQYIWDFVGGTMLKNAAKPDVLKESVISEDVLALTDYYKDNAQIKNAIRFGVIYTLNQTLTF